jgi:ribonuclease HI
MLTINANSIEGCSTMSASPVKIYFDGGSRGNPGPAAGAAYSDWQGGHERVQFLESATNNEAEYQGLLMGIAMAKELGLTHVHFFGDSKLVVMQVSGEWQAKHPRMNELRQMVLQAVRAIPRWDIAWIRRELNAEADRIANEEMDRRLGVERLPDPDPLPPEVKTETPDGKPIRPDILNLNRMAAKAGFGDLMKLKVGGADAWSRASLKLLEESLENFDELCQSLKERLSSDRLSSDLPDAVKEKLLLNALRWSARGLHGELALRKVLVDLEIANKMRAKRS